MPMMLLAGSFPVGAIVGIVVAAVVILLIVGIVAWAISTRNKFVRMDEGTPG